MAEKIIISQLDIDTSLIEKKNGELLRSITELRESQKQLRKDTKNLSEATIDQAQQYAKTDAQLKELNGEYNRNKAVLAETTTGVKGLTQELNKENKTINQLNQNNRKLNGLKKQVNITTEEGRKAVIAINAKIDQNNKLLQKNASALGKQKMNIGNYSSALKGLRVSLLNIASALGFSGLLVGLVNAFKNGIKTIKDFQKSNAILAGVLGKTRSEIKALTDDAIRLGATTAKSSSEVTKLQTAYARLGFTQQEIIDLTEGTINGSIALNAELEQTAELTGAVVNTFDDLKTTDANKILDTLTLSTQKSATNFQFLSTALPIAAGAANGAGVSFEKLVDQLGQAADRGIDASTAATSLRNIYLALSDQGLTLEQAFTKINTSQDKLSASNQLFGKRASVTALALANNADNATEFAKGLDTATGAAKRLAEEQLNTISGDVDLLSSAWEGWILSIDKGDGVISNFVRGSLQSLTDLLNSINSEIEKQEGATNKYFQELKSGGTTVSELEAEIAKLDATVTANGRAATKQREAIRGQKNELEEAIMFYKSYNEVQEQAEKLSKEQGLTVNELNRRLEENNKIQESLTRSVGRGSSASQQANKEKLEQIKQEQRILKATIPLITKKNRCK